MVTVWKTNNYTCHITMQQTGSDCLCTRYKMTLNNILVMVSLYPVSYCNIISPRSINVRQHFYNIHTVVQWMWLRGKRN